VKHKVLETVDSAQGKISETAATTTDTATKVRGKKASANPNPFYMHDDLPQSGIS
jgi:hypothetical protein